MKKLNVTYGLNGASVILILIVLSLCNCTTEYEEYDAKLASVCFIYSGAADSITYSFRLHPETTEGTIEIPFRLMGYAVSHDRKVKVESVLDETSAVEGKDFVMEESILAADSIHGKIKVKVMKSDKLDQQDLMLTIRLRKNEDFDEPPINESTFRIVITNKLTKPDKWPFNEYSRVKHEFVIKVTGIGTGYDKWSGQEIVYWTGILTKALYEYNKLHPGNPLTDENGLLVTF